MDIKSLSDGQKQNVQQFIEKILTRNKLIPSEIEHFQNIVKNIRDAKNLKNIMEKFKNSNLNNTEDIIENKLIEGKNTIVKNFFNL